jgi:hypothetical protein
MNTGDIIRAIALLCLLVMLLLLLLMTFFPNVLPPPPDYKGRPMSYRTRVLHG